MLRARVGDVERNACVDRLTREMVVGRLTEDEFDARVEQALRAQTHQDLAELTGDLDDPATTSLPVRRPSAEPAITLSRRDVGAVAVTTAVLGVLTFLIAHQVTYDSDAIALWLLLWLFGEVCGLTGAMLARRPRR